MANAPVAATPLRNADFRALLDQPRQKQRPAQTPRTGEDGRPVKKAPRVRKPKPQEEEPADDQGPAYR